MGTRNLILSITIITAGLITACTYDQNPVPLPPPSSEETINLEAVFTIGVPDSFNAPYWSTADYIQIAPEEVTKGILLEDGLLNMTGLFEGLIDYNNGDSTGLRIKAAYNETHLFILAEWADNSYNISQASWMYDGEPDPYKPDEDSEGWTSQFNDDNLIFSFPMSNSKKDIWKWSFAISEPLGYAIDMVDDGSGEVVDTGDVLVKRNSDGTDNRTGPAYEWDGVDQEVSRPLAKNSTFLDPAFYLLNKIPFEGNMIAGEVLYQAECSECHGIKGDGKGWDWETNESLIRPSLNRDSRDILSDILGSSATHNGSSHWTKLNETEKQDLLARLRGFSGVPGYYIEKDNLMAPDIQAISGDNLARIDYNSRSKENYKVLLMRPLNTEKSDDIQFNIDTENSYEFDVLLTDNDDPNRVGSQGRLLIFK